MRVNNKADNAEKTEQKGLNLRQSDKILLVVAAVLLVVIILLHVLNAFGLALINGALSLYLPMLLLFVLLGWGVYALIRRARRKVVKTVLTSVSIMVGLVALILAFTYVAYLSYYTVPQKYAILASPTGARKVAVMRVFDVNGDRTEARRAARYEAAPETGEALIPEDVMVIYKAYPRVLGLFYNAKASVEGEVYLAYEQPTVPSADEAAKTPVQPAGHGRLMVEWLDDEAAVRLYTEDAGVSEGGECVLTF